MFGKISRDQQYIAAVCMQTTMQIIRLDVCKVPGSLNLLVHSLAAWWRVHLFDLHGGVDPYKVLQCDELGHGAGRVGGHGLQVGLAGLDLGGHLGCGVLHEQRLQTRPPIRELLQEITEVSWYCSQTNLGTLASLVW